VRIVVLLFVTLVAAALQATLPTLRWTGHATFPFLLGVVMHYALTHRVSHMVVAALWIGILDDGLGRMPLGISSFGYAACGLLVAYYRESMAVRAWTTHMVLGAGGSLVMTIASWLMLAKEDLVAMPWNWVLFKFAGSAITGAMATPVVIALLHRLDRLLGYVPREEAHAS
jgi:rod shape-determining protein MreD